MTVLNLKNTQNSHFDSENNGQMFAFGVEEMRACGAKIAELLMVPSVVYFNGDLGAGKTTLVQGICEYYEYKGVVSSPTYNLIHEYPCLTPDINVNIAHLDLYRVENSEELDMLGLADLLTQRSVLLIEWPEKGAGYIPSPDIEINISNILKSETNQTGRRLEVFKKQL